MFPGWPPAFVDELAMSMQALFLADERFMQAFKPSGIQRLLYYDDGTARTRPALLLIAQGRTAVERISAQEKGTADIWSIVEADARSQDLRPGEASIDAVFERQQALMDASGGLRFVGSQAQIPYTRYELMHWEPPDRPDEKKILIRQGVVYRFHFSRELPARRRNA